ncbi:hypothetical protein [Schaalia hyovaginalis]|uniref:hypothetical protein n=1 Tax=Schaalia hyovaginalis TaxID=29316 RepID=UPI001F2A4447|nr:hypothetical protein [Schaalia hyovaginalis]
MSNALPPPSARVRREGPVRLRPSRPMLPALLLTAALGLSSCTLGPVRIGADGTALPPLTAIEAIRDQAARTEAAAATRAGSLASDTGECESCRTVLNAIEEDSRERGTAIGGVWDPWSGQPPEGAQDVPAIADAPVEVPEFASWLAQTARRDLAIASDPARTTPGEARLLAALALGRYRSALDLAEVYGLEVEAGDGRVEDLNDRLRAITGTDSLSLLGTWGLDSKALEESTTLPPSELEGAQEALGGSDELRKAVAAWDCVAQTLPRAALIDGSAPGPTPRMDALFARADALISAGAVDGRALRCELEARDADSLSMTLIAADLSLLSSDEAAVRLVGAHAALEDLRAFPMGAGASSRALIGAEALAPESAQSAAAGE